MNNVNDKVSELFSDTWANLNTYLKDSDNNSDIKKTIARHDIMIDYVLQDKQKFIDFLNDFYDSQKEEENYYVVRAIHDFMTDIDF